MEIGEPVALPEPAKRENADEKKLKVAFQSKEGRCGDQVYLIAWAENIPSGASAKFEVQQKGATVQSTTEKLIAATARARWESKAKTDERPEPPFELSASADGQSAKSENQFTLKKYDDVAKDSRTIACKSGVFGWIAKFDAALTAGELIITTRIKLLNRKGNKPASAKDPQPEIGDPVTDADKTAMKADIEAKLSNKNRLHREKCTRGDTCDCPRKRGCCHFLIRVIVEFVESGEHHQVNLYEGSGRANATNWTRVKTRDNSWAHETGHLLGFYDEYAGGAVGAAPRWKVQEGGVMNTGLSVYPEYCWDFRDWVAGKTADKWVALKP
jgi:hypothetical protein